MGDVCRKTQKSEDNMKISCIMMACCGRTPAGGLCLVFSGLKRRRAPRSAAALLNPRRRVMTARIGILTFPGLMQLDITGPYAVLAAGPDTRIDLIWKDTRPIRSSDGLILTPTLRMSETPFLDVICVPGGEGVTAMLSDKSVLDFLRNQADTALYAVAVCTGSLILGAAGLLKGKKATCHWQSWDFLEYFGAVPVRARMVEDGKLLTCAGVSAGIDMAFLLAARLWGQAVAEEIQLRMEYAPEPPFNAGSPSSAPRAIAYAATKKNVQRQEERKKAILLAAAALGLTSQ